LKAREKEQKRSRDVGPAEEKSKRKEYIYSPFNKYLFIFLINVDPIIGWDDN
jgi:hypothetical protein